MGEKWEKRLEKIHHFSTKKTIKTGGKNWKNRGKNTKKKHEKTGEKQKLTRNTEKRFGRGAENGNIFGKILVNAENRNENKNKVLSNVTKRLFESKNEVSVQAYLYTCTLVHLYTCTIVH